MEYRFNGKVSLEDFIMFQKFYLKYNVFNGWKKVLYLLFFIFLLILAISHIKEIIDAYNVNTVSQLDSLIIFSTIINIFSEFSAITIIFFLLLFVLLLIIFFKKYLKKQYYSNKFFSEEQYYIFTENQIEIKTDSSCTIITKDKINKIMYNKKNIYIFISLYLVYIVPESFFNNNEFTELKCILDEHYKK